MSWQTTAEHAVLCFNGVELVGRIGHDPRQHGLEMLFPDGDSEILTVELAASGYVALLSEVFVRDYSEHSGVPTVLVEAGVCELIEVLRVGPFRSRVTRLRVLG